VLQYNLFVTVHSTVLITHTWIIQSAHYHVNKKSSIFTSANMHEECSQFARLGNDKGQTNGKESDELSASASTCLTFLKVCCATVTTLSNPVLKVFLAFPS